MLVHSPLLGPTSWSPVAAELELRGRGVLIPSLLGSDDGPAPQWRHGVEAVRTAVTKIASPIALVAHSGAGPLLPSIADAVSPEVAALIFVDASLPPATGAAPLAPSGFLDQLRAISTDGVLPPWSDWFGEGKMRELVPDRALREALEQEMPRLPLAYFEESVPLPERWTEHRCAFLLFTEAYAESSADAKRRGWPVAQIRDVQHLAPATDPLAVAEALLELERALLESE